MKRFIIFIAFFASTALTADHNLFKRCSRVPLCSAFRNVTVSKEAQYTAEIASLEHIDNNILLIPLTTSQGNKLKLQLSLLKNNKVRIKLLEENHKRYEIVDVLVSEPETISYEVSEISDDSITIFSKEDKSRRVVIRGGAPFTLEFYKKGDKPEILFDSSRLVMDNNSTSTAFSFDVGFVGSQALYGLHHHATKLVLPETADGSMDPFRLRNSDTYGYEVGDPMGLYGAVPVVYGHSPQRTSGIFLHNAAQQWIDISYADKDKPSVHFMVEDGTFDIFIMLGPTPREVLRQLTDLTGKPHMPQLWTLGYHQSRYTYDSQDDVKEVIAKMDEYNFPMDAIWLDIDYTDGKKYFTWNATTYSDPVGMQNVIASTNRKLVTIIDPHIKVDVNYAVYSGAKNKYFVRNANGTDFVGDCWPGFSSYIDFLNPEARSYWASLYSYEKFNASTKTLAGTWNDMNEPSVFNAPEDENSLPGTTLHYGNVQHKVLHNMYGFLQSKASHEGLLRRDNFKLRPFVLSRSHFAGSQRYAAVWTGDNGADWSYLAISYSECLLSNVLGHVFCGADIGGFTGNGTDVLLQRWYQAAVWLPFYRSHSTNTVNRREPYLFNDSMRDNIRRSMQTRYRYIPTFYTLFYHHIKTGDPIIRPLFYEYPDMLAYDDHILVGPNILATPVLKEASTVEVHFPGQNSTQWFRADLNGSWATYSGGSVVTIDADLTTSPVFHKSGSVIALWSNVRRSTTDMQNETYTLYVNLDSNGHAEGYLYGDDYSSFDYTNGQFYLLKLTYSENNLRIEQIDGNMLTTARVKNIIVHSVSLSDPTKCDSEDYVETAGGKSLIEIDIGASFESVNGKKTLSISL